MWITTYHRFVSRAAFLDACEQAGWTQTSGQEPDLPPGVALDIVGPLVEPARVGANGIPVPAASQTIRAWKGKAALREAGLLESVERAVNVAGGRVRDAWDGAVTWALHGWYRHLSWGVLLAAYSPQGRFRQIDAGQHVRAAMAVEQLPAGADGR